MAQDLKAAIRSIPDFPKPGIVFRDITTLLSRPDAFRRSLDEFEAFFRRRGVNRIVAIDSRGFIFGGALADRMQVPFVPVRKKGKLPYTTIGAEYALEYGTDSLEMHIDGVNKGDRVAVIDDLLATGGTLEASCRLVEQLGGQVVAVGVLIELSFLNGRKKLARYEIQSLIDYDSE